MKLDLIATCPESTKSVVADELTGLGATDVEPGYMAVHFRADPSDFYRIHLKCSTASQIMQVLRRGSAKDPRMLFSHARRISWPDVFSSRTTYRVDGIAGDRGEGAMSSNEISKAVRMAIEDVFSFKGQSRPKVDVKEPDIVVVAYVHKAKVTISVVTSGMTLHKRGYRLEGHPAPLKETMAAAVLRLAGYDGTTALLDPMCGSGTIAIEGCMMALHKASNIHRKKGLFGFEHLKSFNRDLWRTVQDQVRLEKLEAVQAPIYASDLSQEFVDLAKRNALRARVERHVQFEAKSFFDLDKPVESGLIVTNLPYGTRISPKDAMSSEDLGNFYNAIGDKLKKSFTGWRAALLVADETPWKALRLRPTKKIPLLNGSIATQLLILDIKKGSYTQ